MNVGLIGLGKMGVGLGRNMIAHGHGVAAYDHDPAVREAAREYLSVVDTLPDTKQPGGAMIYWLMVPAGKPVDDVIEGLRDVLAPGDLVIDGGNSNYKDTLRRHQGLHERGIHFIDVGVSGGTDGALRGCCVMAGGEETDIAKVEELLRDIAVPDGYLHAGPVGSGHFLKMVHNGIEYGMMQSIAEGFDLLEKGPFSYDYAQVASVWSHGSVIRGWLMELLIAVFRNDAQLDDIQGIMHSSGEGKWSVETALEFQVAAPVITMSLLARYRSVDADPFAGKIVAALRNQFGGHAVVRKTDDH